MTFEEFTRGQAWNKVRLAAVNLSDAANFLQIFEPSQAAKLREMKLKIEEFLKEMRNEPNKF